MNRIASIVNERINLENINSWLDLGTGNGVVVNDLKFNKTVINKYACEIDIPNHHVLDNTWNWFNDYKIAFQVKPQYDLITMFDFIEHFEKDEGLNLLKEVQTHAKHIILFTPEGFLQQDNITHPNIKPGMIHKSGWEVDDFENCNIIVLPKYHYPQGLNKWFNSLLVWR